MERKEAKDRNAIISEINGPVIKVRHARSFSMNEMVVIGEEELLGEVIEIFGDQATVQVYEDTTGLKPGLFVQGQGLPLFAELGPGIVGHIFDGTQKPLSAMYRDSGPFIRVGKTAVALDRDKAWYFKPQILSGTKIMGGQMIGVVQETDRIAHRVMIPPNLNGRLMEIVPEGLYTVAEKIAAIEDEKGEVHEIKLYQKWPVRQIRPYQKRILPDKPLFTGQRVIDFFFPLAKGGTAAIPGGFGTGKTITQHQLSKWADANIIVYIGCGERGNEMAGVLLDFPNLPDPITGRPLIERTIFIANTSDMAVAAREASIYTGITIAEYYRDMGYHVALMADSTSRWAEALREIAGRLEEMPAEEGFPAYLATRLAQFYERAGVVITHGGETGSVSIIGAVSPPGSDFSEPVTQHTKRYVSTFWALDKELAGARYFPAVNYLNSYSGYVEAVAQWWQRKAGLDWVKLRNQALTILKEDARLMNIVKLIGEDALPDDQKVVFHGAQLIKENFLQQSAFDPIDTYSAAEKQVVMLQIIMKFIERMQDTVVAHRIPVYRIMELPILEELGRMKVRYKGDDLEPFKKILNRLEEQFDDLFKRET
ncbi:MAG: V-type ATP synthase subunit A [Desulfobacterales bacterium]|nr:V-type ATP synthase subunit A [Desulfobacterales bacterium]